MLLSIIIPTMSQSLLAGCMASIRTARTDCVEVIIINQTGEPVPASMTSPCGLAVQDIMPDRRLSAPLARNLGAKHARGRYVMFMDDDAFFYDRKDSVGEICDHLKNQPDLVICDRGFESDHGYVSHWPNQALSLLNYSRYAIEWNCVYRTEKFWACGGFCEELGAGSDGRAQSGEALLTVGRMLSSGCNVGFLKSVRIAHPDPNQFRGERRFTMYKYGAGYSVGRLLPHLSSPWRAAWTAKMVAAAVRDILVPKVISDQYGPIGGGTLGLRAAGAGQLLLGFFDAVRNEAPRPM